VTNLYLDLQNGISGDMAVAALLSLGSNLPLLTEKLKTLELEGYEVETSEERRNGIPGQTFSVHIEEGIQSPRSYADIRSLIERSGLSAREKRLAQIIFLHLAESEARIHGTEPDRVHFHEVGAVDSIVDIVSFSVLYTALRVKRCCASEIQLGRGSTQSRHGIIPIPAPATIEIIRGLPVQGTDIPFELTTPTGAAILKSVVGSFGPLPSCIIVRVGTGFGKRRKPGINALRVFEYEEISSQEKALGDLIAVIELSIDDSTPQEIAYLQERLFEAGSLDVFTTPIFMKKNRPAFNVTVICAPSDLDRIADLILRESSTFGLRYQYLKRRLLERRFEKLDTCFGPVSLKIGLIGNVVIKASPEYEDLRKAARAHGVSLRRVAEELHRVSAKRFPATQIPKKAAEKET
jgi:uncharacterized protein (TIGR00299 family) protein